ncbi:lipase family protein [Nocardioides sp. WS12]|uniref:lipase family protein n=1 Tax=Nocardioides sp. WS12 TaxID=2486272 RepID=UPI0015FD4A90|nr:lipase family protein [Nocardioides sp. WS12]
MRKTIISLCELLAVLIAVVLLPPVAMAEPVPLPEDDPFFAAPADLASYRPGEVIASRKVQVKAFEVPVPAAAWQLVYRTSDRVGTPTVTVTTVIVPTAPWSGPGTRPLVSYQTAEDGVSTRCAPSYALTAGGQGGLTGSYSETPIIVTALLQGWAVSVPDYEGMQSQFLVADVAAKAVLDGLRAARQFTAAGLRDAPVAIWGYSGGAFATANAAQLQGAYAPELPMRAVVLGGLLGDVRATIDAFDGSIAGGAIPMGMHGFDRAYPAIGIQQYLNPLGRQLFETMRDDCLFDAVPRRPFLRMRDIESIPNALDTPAVAAMLRENSPRHRAGTPTAPVYEYHTLLDEFAPIGPAKDALRNYCRGGVAVQQDVKLLGEHLTEIVLGVPGAIGYLRARFAGKPAPSNCAGLLR